MTLLDAISPTGLALSKFAETKPVCAHPSWEFLRREATGWVEICTTCGHEKFTPCVNWIDATKELPDDEIPSSFAWTMAKFGLLFTKPMNGATSPSSVLKRLKPLYFFGRIFPSRPQA